MCRRTTLKNGINRDDQYIRKLLGECLTAALVEIVEKKPDDAIEYLAQYLYTFRKNNPLENEILSVAKEPQSEQSRVDLLDHSFHGRQFLPDQFCVQLPVVHRELDSVFKQIDDFFDDDDVT
ncbi:DPY30 domain-containing protein 1-like isoform X2 [Gigantopelta aegis]|uniref:DPY30 domain-containing protein 1-like isoform X2 n=1 Tax=Gigantopelta aegis TaxID=1735272 RepID=UPI001B88CFF2|nr:DPY30 domain-containing protein 1-like isoform X2 [Gigantopelta aegis]